MVTVQFWTPDNIRNPNGRLAVRATYGQAFDYITAEGAIRAKDGLGIIYRWIAGEWVSL